MAQLWLMLIHLQQLGKLCEAIQWVTHMPIPCYQYSKCLEYALTEDSQFLVVQGKMQGKMRKESTSWMLDQNIYGCSHTLRWLYCSSNEAEQLTLAMIWLQMSHDALPSLE